MLRAFTVGTVVVASLAIGAAQQRPQGQQGAQQGQQGAQQGQQGAQQPQQAPQAQRGGNPAAAPQAPAGPPPKPFIPVAAGTLFAHPDTYYSDRVSLTAPVEEALTKSTFSVAESQTTSSTGSTGHDILIVAPNLNKPVDPNTYVTVIGEVVKFDPAEITKRAKDYKLDLPPDVAARFQGHPVVVATNVINASGVDVAMRLPPPLTAEEETYQKVMRQVGPANTALRGALDKTDGAAIKEQTAILAKAFVQTEAFWKSRSKPDAVKMATDARTMAESIDKAAAAGKWDDAKASAGTLGQQCASCHTTYRERYDDGSFRIKK